MVGIVFQAEGTACAKALVSRKTGKQPIVRAGVEKNERELAAR